ncbi:MAG: DEAD/DEAH box helicase family protein [Oscillospiraceae bacterium]|nr:DEAD/DEAH box helicase family protein [Oscillospiraceae bacterium]
MTGKYYLSEILTPDRFRSDKLNLITAPVGSGKTQFVFDVLAKHSINQDYMLYITDTNINRAQIISTIENAEGYTKNWRDFINTHAKQPPPKSWGKIPCGGKAVTVMNYAQVGALLHYGHPFDWSQFDYVVCDELHNLIYYNGIKPKKGKSSANLLDLTIGQIKHTQYHCPHVKVIGMTATPNVVFNEFLNTYSVLDPQEIQSLRQYEIKNRWVYRDYVKVLREIPKGSKGIIYFDRITKLKEVEDFLQAQGHRTGSFWSLRNDEHPLTDWQYEVRQHIVDNQMIQPDVDILLINKACETGVNIKNDDIGFMIIHAAEYSDTLTQVRGRLRNDLQNLHYYDKTWVEPFPTVPQKYLNRTLTTDEKKALCAELRIMKPSGNEYYKWGKVKEFLQQNGYTVTETTKGHGGKVRGSLIVKI